MRLKDPKWLDDKGNRKTGPAPMNQRNKSRQDKRTQAARHIFVIDPEEL